MLTQLIDAFSEIDDPRCEYKVEHNLIEILIMANGASDCLRLRVGKTLRCMPRARN